MKRAESADIISKVFKSMLSVQIMTMLTGIVGSVVDGMVIGKFLGESAMAAFGFTSSVTLTVAIAGGILSTGTSVVCGNSLGEGRLEDTKRSFHSCFSAALVVSAALALVIVFLASPIARLTGAKGELIPLAADYIRGYGIACPGIILVAFLMPIMQMDGELKRLMAAVAVMTGGDIIVDLLNAIVFRGGMFGMALATTASYYLALLCLVPHFRKKDVLFTAPSLRFDHEVIGQMCKNGLPTAVSQLGRLLLTFALNRYLMHLGGSQCVAANAVILSVGNLCLVPATALASSTQVIAGVLTGEEDRSGIIRLMRAAMRYHMIVNGIGMLVFLALAKPVVGMFYQADSSGINIAVTGFRFFALCMLFNGINLVFRSYCQGSGQTAKAYVITGVDCFVGPLLMALILGGLFGVPAVWLCYAVGEGLTSAVILLLFRIKNKGQNGFDALIPFPESFGRGIEAAYECRLTKRESDKVARISQEAAVFCLNHGADRRTAFLMSLAVEEAVGNVTEHGFADGRPHSVEVRVIKKSDGWILRLRDDCQLFDPRKYMQQYTDRDPSANIGLKLLRDISSYITYVNAMKLNNLTIRV